MVQDHSNNTGRDKYFGTSPENTIAGELREELSDNQEIEKPGRKTRESKYDRDDKFMDCTSTFSGHHPDGSMELSAGIDSDIQKYEMVISEFTEIELTTRKAYHERSMDLSEIAHQQIVPGIDRRPVSAGIEKLLDTAISFIESRSYSNMKEYQREGCPVARELTDDVMLMGDSVIVTRAVGLAQDYSNWLKKKPAAKQEQESNMGYEGEMALSVIKAFISIAEYERFKGK
jgi:hypothetical protein